MLLKPRIKAVQRVSMSILRVAMGTLGCPTQETVTQYEMCLTIMRNCHMRRSHGKSISLLKFSGGFIFRTTDKTHLSSEKCRR